MKDDEFDETYRTHRSYIYWMIGRYVADIAIAEDLTQNTFIKAWLARHTFRGDSSYRTWLTAIAINTALNFLVHQKIRPEYFAYKDLDPDQVYTFSDTLSQTINAQEMNRLYAALNLLPEDMRATIVLRVLHDLDYKEIADHLKIPIGTVRSRLHRAKYLLRDILQ